MSDRIYNPCSPEGRGSVSTYARRLSADTEAIISEGGNLVITDCCDAVILDEAEILELEKFLRDRPAPF